MHNVKSDIVVGFKACSKRDLNMYTRPHLGSHAKPLLEEEETIVLLSPALHLKCIHTHPCMYSCTASSRPSLAINLNYVRLSPALIAIAAAMLLSNIHRQEQPPIAQRAFMSRPFVQHGDLETHPAQIFGQVFTSIGVTVQADDQLIAVDAVGTCKLEEGGEAVKEKMC